MKTILELFWSFCQIGYTSFGGMSMVPLINDEMVSHGWMTAAEVSDIVAIAEMTPGPLGLNCATFAGLRVIGPFGAIVCVLGILMPTLTVCALAAVFFEKFKNSRTLQNVMVGVRPAALGIILAVMITLSRTNYFVNGALSWKTVGVGLVAAFLLIKGKWSVPKVIVVSALLGLLT